jgi:phosphoglycolate phosphatase
MSETAAGFIPAVSFFRMKNIELVIFDLDGTLVDAYAAIIKSFNHVMRLLKLKAQPANVIRKAVGWGDEELLRPFVDTRQLKTALRYYRRHHGSSLIKHARLFPHVRQVLGCLKEEGVRLAVASNRPTAFSLILARHFKIEKYFDLILCADRLKQGKPHPAILQSLMKRLKVSPRQTFYVGDMAIDAECARRAKVRAVIVTTGSSSLSEIRKERPYRVIKRIGGLLRMCRRLGR